MSGENRIGEVDFIRVVLKEGFIEAVVKVSKFLS